MPYKNHFEVYFRVNQSMISILLALSGKKICKTVQKNQVSSCVVDPTENMRKRFKTVVKWRPIKGLRFSPEQIRGILFKIRFPKNRQKI